MAKIKLGLIVSDIRGKVGGVVASRNGSGAYMRKNTSPTNPQTSKQMTQRGLMPAVTTTWKALSDAQRLAWNGAAQSGQWNRPNSLGESVQPSGFQLYTRLNMARLSNGQSELTDPPVKAVFPSVSIGAFASQEGGAATLAYTGSITDFALIVHAGAPGSAGVSATSQPMKKVGTFTSASPITLTTGLEAAWGTLGLENQKQTLKIDIMHIASGDIVPLDVVSTVVVAP